MYCENATPKVGLEGGRRGPRKHLLGANGDGKIEPGCVDVGGVHLCFLESVQVLLATDGIGWGRRIGWVGVSLAAILSGTCHPVLARASL